MGLKKKSQAGKIAQKVKTVATKPGGLGSVSGISSSSWEEKNGFSSRPLTSPQSPWFRSVSGSGHYFWDCCEGAVLVRDHVEKRKWNRLMGEEHWVWDCENKIKNQGIYGM